MNELTMNTLELLILFSLLTADMTMPIVMDVFK